MVKYSSNTSNNIGSSGILKVDLDILKNLRTQTHSAPPLGPLIIPKVWLLHTTATMGPGSNAKLLSVLIDHS